MFVSFGLDKAIAWKRVVQGVREMCDVCETTLFNYHWTCGKCGFVVCIDCYKSRKYGEEKKWNNEPGNDRDNFSWLFCITNKPHEQEKLILTQIIAGDSLKTLSDRVHTVRALWNIQQNCDCLKSRESRDEVQKGSNELKNVIKSILSDYKINGFDKSDISSSSDSETVVKKETTDTNNSALSWLADVALKNEDQKCAVDKTNANSDNVLAKMEIAEEQNNDDDNSSESSESSNENDSALRNLLMNKSTPNSPPEQIEKKSDALNSDATKPITAKTPKSSYKIFKDLMTDNNVKQEKSPDENKQRFSSDTIGNKRRFQYIPARTMSLALSESMYSGVKHTWYCEGKLLRLLEPNNAKNLQIFQDQWKRKQPILVSNVNKCLNSDLWRPESFSRDFGDDANDLINCLTGTLVPNQPMKRFWDGFDLLNKRIKDENGEPMLLKLKDWPPGEDFAETLPTRYADLMSSLPLGDYTKREGKFNLASRLPECFVKPDLGPKMYNAYGSALHPEHGTTNLHLDISDAVNVMVYVGIPKDASDDAHIKEAFKSIDESGCDVLQRRRVREKNELPGAIWHIYAPRDADKIRDLLNKVAIERKIRLEPHSDPIHDQSSYLDSKLRQKLYDEYGVVGYTIAQCLGDAVFIPAGAPHQVQNLSNCIKVAEDFVTPENVSECYALTHEFRALSDTHSNHEDKLQIKNIIYHAVKDALSVLSNELAKRIEKSDGLDQEINDANDNNKLESDATEPVKIDTIKTDNSEEQNDTNA